MVRTALRGGSFDERGSDCGRRRDRLAGLPETVEVEGDSLADQLLDLLLRAADDTDAGQVGTVGDTRFGP